MRAILILFLTAVAAALLAGCHPPVSQTLPASWPIANLTMPTQSTFVTNITTALPQEGRMPGSKTHVINFDNAAGYAVVRGHFESCLRKDGYLLFSDSTDPVPNVDFVSPDGRIKVKLYHTAPNKANNTALVKSPIGDYSVHVTVYDQPFQYLLDNAKGKL